jgi:AAA+ superfamily predicted ATPase
MEINSDLMNRHSEEEFAERLRIVSDAGSGVIHVRCAEVMRGLMSIRKSLLLDGNQYKEWDVVNGFKEFTTENMYTLNVQGDGMANLMEAYQTPHRRIIDPGSAAGVPEDTERRPLTFYTYVNPQFWMSANPILTHLTLYYASVLPSTDYRILLVTPDMNLPDQLLSENTYSVRFNTPGLGELRESMDSILEGIEGDDVTLDISEEERERVCFVGAGMPKDQFDMAVALSAVQSIETGAPITGDVLSDGVSEGKTEIVNKNDLLELYHPEDMHNVGGMENLKEWVNKRRACYSDEAREFGIEPPKGMVFVGPPGTGKSLAAKAVSKVLGVPLVRLDFGRVFNSLVGESEARIRHALRMVEDMSPCVLFCDEVDKGLGGIGGSGDSGTSSRVLGSFLTWLQDCKHPVFTMVTANNVDGLPPELLRRGRFDAIFSTGLPSPAERLEVLHIHLRKRDCELKLTAAHKKAFTDASNKYVPAEIESAVKDGLIEAFHDEADLSIRYIINALTAMVPLTTAFNEQIQKMTNWAHANATPASAVVGAVKAAPVTKAPRRTRKSTVKTGMH